MQKKNTAQAAPAPSDSNQLPKMCLPLSGSFSWISRNFTTMFRRCLPHKGQTEICTIGSQVQSSSKTLLGHDAVLIGHIGGSRCAGVFTLHDLGLNGIRPAKTCCVLHGCFKALWNVTLKMCNMLSFQRQRNSFAPNHFLCPSNAKISCSIFSSPNSRKFLSLYFPPLMMGRSNVGATVPPLNLLNVSCKS